MAFIDRVRIWAKAGDGGKGCCSFHREKFVPLGGPDGGDGGKGGDVLARVNPHLNNLEHLSYQPHQFADKGRPGQSKQKTGASGKDIILEVPPGTCIYRFDVSDENFERSVDLEERELVADMIEPGQEFLLCKGGDGGRGNVHFKSSTNRAPRKFEKGWPGEKGQFYFELKSIADVGLVGFPNAGKSSLLSRLSAAKPKVAPYPFTTLRPIIGVMEFEDGERMTVADIPGLIEGAHQGVGLGHDFLRHVERCKILLVVLDMAGSECRDPAEDYRQIRKEIKLYREELSQRPFFVAANKSDLEGFEENLKNFQQQFDVPVCAVSADAGEGLQNLKTYLKKME